MDIVLFGIQGSGKGTLGKKIAQKYNYNYFETGEELRKLIKSNSPLGEKINNFVKTGKLVTNEIIIEIVKKFIEQNNQNIPIVFDGIPREMKQAILFENLLKKKQRKFSGILINIPEKEAIKRLTTRRICPKCKTIYPAFYKFNQCEKCNEDLITRSDDQNIETIKTRITTFNKLTIPVIEKLKQENKLIEMDGTPKIETTTKTIFNIVENLNK